MAEEMLITQNAQQNEQRDFVIFDAILNLIVETCRTGYCEEKSSLFRAKFSNDTVINQNQISSAIAMLLLSTSQALSLKTLHISFSEQFHSSYIRCRRMLTRFSRLNAEKF
jgi:hypothetical protein